MGYLLPIRPIQSGQYANRISMESYNFATIEKLQSVKLKSDLLEETLHLQNEDNMRKDREKSVAVPSPQPYKGHVPPSLANLSPIISQIVGKGISVNTYI